MRKFLALVMFVLLTTFISGCLEQRCYEGKCKDKPGPGAAEEKKAEEKK